MEENLSVDKQIVPFKGRSCLCQYNSKKPHKWGYKTWVLCGASGYAYDFECYTGRAENALIDGEEDCGASGNVVIRLSWAVPANVNHKVYFNNYFTSPDLQLYLAKKGIWSIGTVRGNRIPQCSLKSDVDLRSWAAALSTRTLQQWTATRLCQCDGLTTKLLRCCQPLSDVGPEQKSHAGMERISATKKSSAQILFLYTTSTWAELIWLTR